MTTGDWDYSNPDWTLDTSVYVSPPSSFRKNPTAGLTDISVFIKTSVVSIDKVKEGRFVTQLRFFQTDNVSRFEVYFRRQDSLNQYGVEVLWQSAGGRWRVFRDDAGVRTVLREVTASSYPPSQVFWLLRVTWYNTPSELLIRVERWTGSAWEKLFDDTLDPLNKWTDIGGRVGFYVNSYMGWTQHLDDTEIWGVP